MPCAQIVRVFDLAKEEHEAEEQRWMYGAYMMGRVTYHALTLDSDVPLTKAEQKKGASEADILKAKAARKKHDAEWMEALSDPRAFGKLMGLPHVLGEPPESEPVTHMNATAKREAAEQAFVAGLREQVAGQKERAHRAKERA
jgi:hypothetical protein